MTNGQISILRKVFGYAATDKIMAPSMPLTLHSSEERLLDAAHTLKEIGVIETKINERGFMAVTAAYQKPV